MLHIHGTPCGGQRIGVGQFLRNRFALIPWQRPEDIAIAAEVCRGFVLDNSAFTAWKSGEPITDWSGYYERVDLWRRHPGFDWAIIPDVIDGDEQANDDLLAEWPFEEGGVPTYHMHESLERLERLVVAYPRVALGSSGQWPTPGTASWWRRMAEVMAVACDEHGRPRAKLHGLRMLNPAIFHSLPLASADSTNAVRNANLVGRFGMYPPENIWQRMATIADRIEFHQSAKAWDREATFLCPAKLSEMPLFAGLESEAADA